jgi:antitoxin (DNA-binding transcriptional repressor) of toxin-antitoxin stability system
MIKATIHSVKTHLSRLLKELQKGETVVILHGKTPVAQLTAIEPRPSSRPKIGMVTSAGVKWTGDAFKPLSKAELKEWGL